MLIFKIWSPLSNPSCNIASLFYQWNAAESTELTLVVDRNIEGIRCSTPAMIKPPNIPSSRRRLFFLASQMNDNIF